MITMHDWLELTPLVNLVLGRVTDEVRAVEEVTDTQGFLHAREVA